MQWKLNRKMLVYMPSINAFIKNSLNENINDSSKHLYSFIKSKQINNIGVAPFKSNKLFYIYSQKKLEVLTHNL